MQHGGQQGQQVLEQQPCDLRVTNAWQHVQEFPVLGTQRLDVIGDEFGRTKRGAQQHHAAGCGFKRLVTEPTACWMPSRRTLPENPGWHEAAASYNGLGSSCYPHEGRQ